MIKVNETKEEKMAAFKRSVGLRKVWEDLTSVRCRLTNNKPRKYRLLGFCLLGVEETLDASLGCLFELFGSTTRRYASSAPASPSEQHSRSPAPPPAASAAHSPPAPAV